jgi:hypothetical protein
MASGELTKVSELLSDLADVAFNVLQHDSDEDEIERIHGHAVLRRLFAAKLAAYRGTLKELRDAETAGRAALTNQSKAGGA